MRERGIAGAKESGKEWMRRGFAMNGRTFLLFTMGYRVLFFVLTNKKHKVRALEQFFVLCDGI
jgi:hypothetical protein